MVAGDFIEVYSAPNYNGIINNQLLKKKKKNLILFFFKFNNCYF